MSPDIDIPSSWRRSAQAILAHRLRTVLVIGAADRGKSTYCGFLAASLRAAGASVGFVDADIGQKDVGPPATVSLARIADEGSLARARAACLYFVGDVDPVGHFLPLTIGTRRMTDVANTDFVVIDTPGFMDAAGGALRAYQIESLRPDVIVALQTARELDPTLRAYRMHSVFRLKTSAQAMSKPRAARQSLRRHAFRAHFANGSHVVLERKRVAVQRARVFVGEPFEDARFVYAERTAEGIVAIGDASVSLEREWRLLAPDFADNLLCGVLNAAGDCCGLGIIERIDFTHDRLHLFTPVSAGEIGALQFGDLYVNRHGQELRRKRPGMF